MNLWWILSININSSPILSEWAEHMCLVNAIHKLKWVRRILQNYFERDMKKRRDIHKKKTMKQPIKSDALRNDYLILSLAIYMHITISTHTRKTHGIQTIPVLNATASRTYQLVRPLYLVVRMRFWFCFLYRFHCIYIWMFACVHLHGASAFIEYSHNTENQNHE